MLRRPERSRESRRQGYANCSYLCDFSEAFLARFVKPDDSAKEQSETPLIKQTSPVKHSLHFRGVYRCLAVMYLHGHFHIGKMQH